MRQSQFVYSSAPSEIRVTSLLDAWRLTRRGETIAIIENTRGDYSNWFVYLRDDRGDLVFRGAWKHLASLKTCLRMWVRRNHHGVPPFFVPEVQPE